MNDSPMSNEWAWISLSAYSEELGSDQIAQLLPRSEAVRGNSNLAATEFGTKISEKTIGELIGQVSMYLETYADELKARLPRADFQLRIGWMPRSPQESIAFPPILLSNLAKLNAAVMLDVYDNDD
jgi:hypothetical protein